MDRTAPAGDNNKTNLKGKDRQSGSHRQGFLARSGCGMNEVADRGRWYEGVTRYQWLVLVIASLGWVFDIFEGQIFVASRNLVMRSLLPEGESEGMVAFYANVAYGAFLLGGALGGIGFGIAGDRIARPGAGIH